MSDRHMHITSYLYDTDPARLAAFEAEARKHFQLVQRVVRPAAPTDVYGGGEVIAFVLYSKDGGGFDDLIYTLPEAAEALSGILVRDIEIVSAWESVSGSAQRVWRVAGHKPVDGHAATSQETIGLPVPGWFWRPLRRWSNGS